MLVRRMLQEGRLRRFVRKAATNLLITLLMAIAIPVFIAEPLAKLAEEAGWYEHVGRFMSAALLFVTGIWFIAATAFIGGLTAGVWLDLVLQKREGGERLNALRKEGVRLRNDLLSPQQDFDYLQARATMVEWSNRTVSAMKDAGISIGLRSRFETLDRHSPEVIGTRDRPRGQIQLEGIWNKKLDLLLEAIDTIGH